MQNPPSDPRFDPPDGPGGRGTKSESKSEPDPPASGLSADAPTDHEVFAALNGDFAIVGPDGTASAMGEDPGVTGSDESPRSKTQFYTLDHRFVREDRLGKLIFTGLVAAGATIWMAIHWWLHGADLFFQMLAHVSLLLVTALALFSMVWPRQIFQRTRWRADTSGLEIQKGVIWRHRIIVPLSRVQHADVTQGPVQRLFGLGTLVVHTAGTSNASVELAGIDHQAAVEVRDMIIRFRSVAGG
jgi:membrane protein YdbS with pleckstrin-like domain